MSQTHWKPKSSLTLLSCQCCILQILQILSNKIPHYYQDVKKQVHNHSFNARYNVALGKVQHLHCQNEEEVIGAFTWYHLYWSMSIIYEMKWMQSCFPTWRKVFLIHSSSLYLKHMRCCPIQRRETCMTKVENKRSKREAWAEEHRQWTFSTCSLEVGDECREREKVRFVLA